MKKKKIDFESQFWYRGTKLSCLTLLDAFFEIDSLADVKKSLFDVMNYSIKPKILMKNAPSLTQTVGDISGTVNQLNTEFLNFKKLAGSSFNYKPEITNPEEQHQPAKRELFKK